MYKQNKKKHISKRQMYRRVACEVNEILNISGNENYDSNYTTAARNTFDLVGNIDNVIITETNCNEDFINFNTVQSKDNSVPVEQNEPQNINHEYDELLNNSEEDQTNNCNAK